MAALCRIFFLPLMVLLCLSSLGWGSEENPDLRLRLERFRQLEGILDLLEREFVEGVESQRLWNHGIAGMVAALDPHSYYLDQRQSVLHVPGLDGESRGFGFDWYHDPLREGLFVRRVLARSPAYLAGLVAGDMLLQVNGQNLLQVAPQTAWERLSRADDRSTLTIRRADGSLKELTLQQQDLVDDGIAHAYLLSSEEGVGYIHISRFFGEEKEGRRRNAAEGPAATLTGQAFRRHLNRLQEAGLRSLVLDLRGNPGGSIPAAVEVADCFLSGSERRPLILARQRSRNPSQQRDWVARSDSTYPRWPLTLLIDGGTASAAEVLTLALQEHRRAVVLGARSMGKDSVQQTFYLENNAALRLTVARYLSPQGNSLDPQGILPDIMVAYTDLDRLQLARRALLLRQEQALPDDLKDVYDPVLKRAQEVLRALFIFQGHDTAE